MDIIGTLASRAAQSTGNIQITYEEYNELCEAVNALPSQSRSVWDNVILNFQYQGRSLELPRPVLIPQGGRQ